MNKKLVFDSNYSNVSNDEVQWIQINGDNSNDHKPIVIVLAYRPPNGNSSSAYEVIKDYKQAF